MGESQSRPATLLGSWGWKIWEYRFFTVKTFRDQTKSPNSMGRVHHRLPLRFSQLFYIHFPWSVSHFSRGHWIAGPCVPNFLLRYEIEKGAESGLVCLSFSSSFFWFQCKSVLAEAAFVSIYLGFTFNHYQTVDLLLNLIICLPRLEISEETAFKYILCIMLT